MAVGHRNAHYGLWFLFFGLIPLIVALTGHTAFSAAGSSSQANVFEALWLIGAGVLGVVLGNPGFFRGRLAQPYDLLVGIVFAAVGLLGLVGDFGVQTGSVALVVNRAGLLLGSLYPLLYLYLGFRSLHHGLENAKNLKQAKDLTYDFIRIVK
jgi:hypothetical protein